MNVPKTHVISVSYPGLGLGVIIYGYTLPYGDVTARFLILDRS